MELKEFISEVLTDIFDGVSTAQDRISDKGGKINPETQTFTNGVKVCAIGGSGLGAKCVELCVAEFDVALTVSDKKNNGGKIGVLLANVGMGIDRSETAQITRVKFSVPYRLP